MFSEYRPKHFAKRLPCMAGMCAKEAAIPFFHTFPLYVKISRQGQGGREADCTVACYIFLIRVKIRGQGQAAAKGTAKESWGSFTKHEKTKTARKSRKNEELKKMLKNSKKSVKKLDLPQRGC